MKDLTDKGAFEQLAQLVIEDTLRVIMGHPSSLPDSFWVKEVWDYECIETHKPGPNARVIKVGEVIDFGGDITGSYYVDVRKFRLKARFKYDTRTGEVLK